MPELPEVETVVRDLRPHLAGRKIVAVHGSRKKLRRPWSRTWNKTIIGRRIDNLNRRGKWIVIELHAAGSLICHLGMTGQLTIANTNDKKADHTHLVFGLDSKEIQLRFRDVRRFGSITFVPDKATLGEFFDKAGLGPEPFDVSSTYLCKQIQKSARCLKAILLDQRVVAGVGNIYADELLFVAKLSPYQLGTETSKAEIQRLRKAIVTVLTFAIEKRGSSIRNYVGGSGLKGEYQNEFRVYGKTGAPCKRCKAPIERVKLAARSTHFCPACQPAPAK